MYPTIVLSALIFSQLVASAYAAQAFADQQPVRSDGRCGPYYGQADCNASFGDPNRPMLCCSKFGFCGSTNDHCNWSGRFAKAPEAEFVPCTQANTPNICNAGTECCDTLNGVCSFIGTDPNATAPDGTCALNVNQNQGAPRATAASSTATAQAANSTGAGSDSAAAPTATVAGGTSAPGAGGGGGGGGGGSGTGSPTTRPTAPNFPDSNNLDGSLRTTTSSARLASSYTIRAVLLGSLLIATILLATF